jgi:LemA protein
VLKYNNKIQTIPSNIIAGMFNFAAREFFEVTEPEARETPKVQF